MCSSNPLNLPSAFSILDPVQGTGKLWGKTKDALTPEIPAMPAPPTLQEQKTPDWAALRKRRTGSSTLLTGPQGVSTGALTTGAPTLLGG